jgi:prefoldin subunit 5
MRGIVYNGIQSLKGKSPEQAFDILYRHCDEMAQFIMRLNKEIEELKDEVEQLRSR